MAYELRFTFTGLCILVPDLRDTARKKMHVLALSPQGGANPCNSGSPSDHCIYGYYNKAHLNPGATSPDPSPPLPVRIGNSATDLSGGHAEKTYKLPDYDGQLS